MTIYTDNAATTKMSDTALAAMLPCLQDNYGNPSSLHSVGQRAAEALQGARETVARLPGLRPQGDLSSPPAAARPTTRPSSRAARLGARKGKKHIISTAFEHHAVLHTLDKLEKEGFEVELLPVRHDRHRHARSRWQTAIRPDTCLVTIMYANNEIGSIQPIARDRRGVPGKGRAVPHGCGAGGGPSAHRRAGAATSTCCPFPATSSTVPRAVGVLYVREGRAADERSSTAAPRSGASGPARKICPASWAWRRRWKRPATTSDENAAKVDRPAGPADRGALQDPPLRPERRPGAPAAGQRELLL